MSDAGKWRQSGSYEKGCHRPRPTYVLRKIEADADELDKLEIAAVEAFQRGDRDAALFGRRNFDAQSDPAVRIEAGRIRRGLEHYYLVSGPGEPVVITKPKGGYVPAFEWGMGMRAAPTKEELVPASINPVETLPEISVKRPVSDTFWSAPRMLSAGLSLFCRRR